MNGDLSTSDLLRRVPCHPDAERALLGAILLNNRAFEDVSETLQSEYFAEAVNCRVYELISEMVDKGQPANPITIRPYIENDDLVQQAGGAEFIASLAASAVTIINARHYADLIYDLYLRRQLIHLGTLVVNRAFDASPEETAQDQIESVESQLFHLTSGKQEGCTRSAFEAARAAVSKAEAAYKRGSSLVGLGTGLVDINRRLGGLHAGDLIILAGRPSMGKTALATTIAYNAATSLMASQGVCAFFSLEMPHDQLIIRPLAQRTMLDVHKIRNGQVSGADIDLLTNAANALEKLPLVIDDTSDLTVSALRTRCRRIARKHASRGGLKLVVIDYIQLIGTARAERRENRVQEISAITRGLKALAKEFDVPVLALSQLSRAVEIREDKRPMLSDLRESGSIEQDADVVMFVFREEYYLERSEPTGDDKKLAQWARKMEAARDVCECIVAKQRQGPVGVARLRFNKATTWFADFDGSSRAGGIDGEA
jgi:replicative DNA helicase